MKEKRQYKKEIKALHKLVGELEQQIMEKNELIEYYMEKFHTYKAKSLELRRKIMEIEKNG